MSLLSASQQARITKAITLALPDTAYVVRTLLVNDGKGGEVETTIDEPPFPALLVQWAGRRGGEEADVGGRFEEAVRYKLVAPAGTDITARDQIKVTSAGVNRTFEVLAVLPESWEVARQVMLVERLSG